MFWRKAQRFFAIAMGAFFGVFLGYCLWTAWSHAARPELYAMTSAPWWVGVLVYAVGCALCELVLLAGWLFARYRAGRSLSAEQNATPDNQSVDS